MKTYNQLQDELMVHLSDMDTFVMKATGGKYVSVTSALSGGQVVVEGELPDDNYDNLVVDDEGKVFMDGKQVAQIDDVVNYKICKELIEEVIDEM